MATLRAKQYPFYTVYKYEFSYLDFKSLSGANNQFKLFDFPQRHNVAFVKLWVTQAFNGGSISAFNINVRPGTNTGQFGASTAVFGVYNAFLPQSDYAGIWVYANQLTAVIGGTTRGYIANQEGSNAVWLNAVATGGNLSALVQGQATIWVGTIPTF